MKSSSKWLNPSKDSDGKHFKSYEQWQGIHKRCSSKYQLRFPTYVGCTVHPDWLSYDVWMEWANTQIGFNTLDEKGLIYQLDKDFIVPSNKSYSPEHCVFIPAKLNSFILTNSKRQGKHPLGVQYNPRLNKFFSEIRLGERKQKYLGSFNTALEAQKAYLTAKCNYALILAEKYEGLVDPRVIQRLRNFNLTLGATQ